MKYDIFKRIKYIFVMLIIATLGSTMLSGCSFVQDLGNDKTTSGQVGQSGQEVIQTTLDPNMNINNIPMASDDAANANTDSTVQVVSPTATPTPEHILVSFIGDCTLGEALAWNGSDIGFDAVIDGDYEYCFSQSVHILEQDDMTLANLEGALTDEIYHLDKEFVFGSPMEYVQILQNGSIEAVNLANNHTYDYLDAGYLDTTNTLDEAGIVWSDEVTIATYEVRGVIIGMAGTSMPINQQAMYNAIDQMRAIGCNIIIISCHWGDERDYTPNDDQIVMGHNLIDYGADIVIGTHPHRLQPIELYNGHYIAYCLSNFVFGGNTGLSDPDTCILQCEFVMDPTNTYCVEYNLNVIPYCQTSSAPSNDYCPMPYDWGSTDYYRVMERLGWSQEDE